MVTRARACLAGVVSVVVAVIGLAGCGSHGGQAGGASAAPTPKVPAAPLTIGAWTYYGTDQGLSADVHDVSADEGGNVYVAGGDALYAKPPGAERFGRFDAANAGLTQNCNDFSAINDPFPPKPFYLCPVISVAGGAPGRAIVGLKGLDQSADLGATWIFKTGGADVVSYDPAAGKVTRERHVEIGSPPHIVCGAGGEVNTGTCSVPTDYWWNWGRRLLRQVWHVVVNHDHRTAMYGDAWFGGNHGTFAVLLANADARGWTDRTAGWDPDQWADAKDVWEHMHPAVSTPAGAFLGVEGYALSLDPRDGTPWGSSGIRTAYVIGYGASLTGKNWWDMGPGTPEQYLRIWSDYDDGVRSMSHCPDGTLWIGSITHGLARIDPSGALSFPALPNPGVNFRVSALACDATDGALWVGLAQGGVLRLRDGTWETMDVAGAPEFAHHPVASIQIDAWSKQRVAYFAFDPTLDASGAILAAGGIGAFGGK